MKNHTFNINDATFEGVRRISIPDGYRETIESGDTIDNTFKVIGQSKVDKNTLIVACETNFKLGSRTYSIVADRR
jgi:hypothetical protein